MERQRTSSGTIVLTADEDGQLTEDVAGSSDRRKSHQPSEANGIWFYSFQSCLLSDSEVGCLIALRSASGVSSWRDVLQHLISSWMSSRTHDFSTPVHITPVRIQPNPTCVNTEVNDSVSSKTCKISDSIASVLEQGMKTASRLMEDEAEKHPVETGQLDTTSEQQRKKVQDQVFQMPSQCFLNPRGTAELEQIRLECNLKHWPEVIECLIGMWKEHRIQKMALKFASRMISTSSSSARIRKRSRTTKRQAHPEDQAPKRRKLLEEVVESVIMKDASETSQQVQVQPDADVWKTVNVVHSTDHEQQQQPIQTASGCVLTAEQTARLQKIHHATNSSTWREVFDHLINLWEQERVRRVALSIAGGALSTLNEKSTGAFVFPLGEQASTTLDDEGTVEARNGRHVQVMPTEQGNESSELVDGNESWDDGCGSAEDIGEEGEAVQPLTMKGPGGQEIKYAAPLLSKKYYLKFSNEARQKRCSREGDDKTVAQMANARRLLVERRQLIKLLALVRCPKEGCGELLDQSTMKCLVIGFTCNFKAMCCGKRHPFQWATSSSLSYASPKKTYSTYTLNIVTPAAAVLSGNGPARMGSFADALNLQWACKEHHERVQRTCVMPAVEKCTKITQEEMFQNLLQQDGRIVLAGDGQFDSPGSCASSCTYSLAVAGIERDNGKDKEFYPSGYVVSQAVADRRHADDKSPAMEHVAMHTALRPFYNNNVTVHELVTDGHSQVTASFKKVLAASKEKEDNLRTGKTNSEKMDQFIKMLQHHNLLSCSANDAVGIHSFYAQIRHSVDTWHEGKNIRKRAKKVAATAPIAERASYQAFAGYLQKHLWHCSEKAEGDAEEFKERWLGSVNHVQGDHRKCQHPVVKKKDGVSTKTAAFGTLKKLITDIAKKAEQLCRFRHTGGLESFHQVSLIYSSKRIFYTYDVLTMKKRLAVLHFNHNINRPWKHRENGEIIFGRRWSKASKIYVPQFKREEANFDYIGHLMAAVLCERVTGECNFVGRWGPRKISPQHPRHIRRTLAPYAELPAETLKKWKTRYPAYRKATAAARSRDSSSDDEEVSEDNATPSTDDDDDDHDDDYNDSDSSGDEEH